MTDFGKLLEEWERLKAVKAGNAGKDKRSEEIAQRSRSALERAMLSGGGPSSKDEEETADRPLTRPEIAAMPVDAVLDLHGLTAAAALESLRDFFRTASDRGLDKVLVIHGKGLHSEEGPVLGKTVRRFLETSPLAGRNGPADRRSGGSGAVWVLIRKSGQRSR